MGRPASCCGGAPSATWGTATWRQARSKACASPASATHSALGTPWTNARAARAASGACASSGTAAHRVPSAAGGGSRSTIPVSPFARWRMALIGHGGGFSASRGEKPIDRPAWKVPAGAWASTA